jgi:phosphinothricin acetyltransferase
MEQMVHRIQQYTEKYPWLVAEENGKILGYAYASSYRERKAYQWSCECSVYLAPESRKKGIAKQLYTELFRILTNQGLRNVYAVITLPNHDSQHFHASCGFEHLGIFRNVGYKLGAWHDVLWMVKTLPQSGPVEEPKWRI